MQYITERITNIGELEKIIEHSYFLAQQLLNTSPENDRFKELVCLLNKAKEFEFCLERRKTDYKYIVISDKAGTKKKKKALKMVGTSKKPLTIPLLIDGKIICRSKYRIQGKNCGRDADGVFHCECGKCIELS